MNLKFAKTGLIIFSALSVLTYARILIAIHGNSYSDYYNYLATLSMPTSLFLAEFLPKSDAYPPDFDSVWLFGLIGFLQWVVLGFVLGLLIDVCVHIKRHKIAEQVVNRSTRFSAFPIAFPLIYLLAAANALYYPLSDPDIFVPGVGKGYYWYIFSGVFPVMSVFMLIYVLHVLTRDTKYSMSYIKKGIVAGFAYTLTVSFLIFFPPIRFMFMQSYYLLMRPVFKALSEISQYFGMGTTKLAILIVVAGCIQNMTLGAFLGWMLESVQKHINFGYN